MKRGLIVLLFILAFTLPSISSATDTSCALSATLINQNPYPALPGEYVELTFQLSGAQSSNCEGAKFEIVPSYPFSLDEGISPKKVIDGDTWLLNYETVWMVGYRVLIDKNALNEKYELEIKYAPGNWPEESSVNKKFNISIKDLMIDFEVYVNDYDINTKELSFEILNIGDSDVEALTIEIPKQDSINIKGANRKVVGDLDSNEYTTANFETTIPGEGDINLKIFYTDEINERRSIEKTVHFDPEYYDGLVRDQKSTPVLLYLVILALAVWIVWSKVKKYKKKNKK